MELYEIEYFDLPNYRITKCGRVWSCRANRFLSIQKNPDNHYKFIFIKRKKYYIHRLVGYTFIDNPYNKNTIDHIDRNRQNNNLTNLRWVSIKENNNNKEIPRGSGIMIKRNLGVGRKDIWERHIKNIQLINKR